MNSRALAELQALARRDIKLSGAIRELEVVQHAVAHIRARFVAIDAFLATYSMEEQRLRENLGEAEGGLVTRREELKDAERTLASARDEEREQARMAVGRAEDRVAAADARVLRGHQALEDLRRNNTDFSAELLQLESEARELSAPSTLASPGTGPGALLVWATRANATLLVAHSQLAADRDWIIREASEIATMLTGVPTYGLTAAQALEQVEIQA
jgi:chromosome segregation ATPase